MQRFSTGRLRLLLPLIVGFSTAPALADSSGDTGAALLLPFKQQLIAALSAGLEEGPGPAIEACRIQAPAIAGSLSVDGVTVGRTSHRLRNPDNQGPAWATAALETYLQAGAGLAPQTVALEDGLTGYIEPIITQPLCLACHGSGLSPDVQAALEADYPDDQATGFEAGELRGVFWVSFPANIGDP